jgi:hypothetical protein
MKLTTTILYCPFMLDKLTEWMLVLRNLSLLQQVLIAQLKYGLTLPKTDLTLKLTIMLRMSLAV